MSPDRPAILVLGPPGAGKTTLALGLCHRFPQLGHLAPRRFLLDERRRGSDLARRAFIVLERQTLLPDRFFVEVAERLASEGRFQGGLVFEGLPVTVAQAEMLWDTVLGRSSLSVVTIVLQIPEAVMRDRIAARWTCEACERAGRAAASFTGADRCQICGLPLKRRQEDAPARLTARLRAQQAEAAEVVNWLAARAVVEHFDGERPAQAVLAEVADVVMRAVPRLADDNRRGETDARHRTFQRQQCPRPSGGC